MLIENKGKNVEFIKCKCIAKILRPCGIFPCAMPPLQPQTELSSFPLRRCSHTAFSNSTYWNTVTDILKFLCIILHYPL